MKKNNKVLFITDGIRDDSRILRDMYQLFCTSISELCVLAVTPFFPGSLKQYATEFDEFIIANLNEAHSRSRPRNAADEPTIECQVMHSNNVFIDIMHKLLRENFDHIVKQPEPVNSAHGFSALDMSLLRKCPKPLFLLKSRDNDDAVTLKTVTVAIDPEYYEMSGYHLSMALLKHADLLATNLATDITIVSCWDSIFKQPEELPFQSITEQDIINDEEKMRTKQREALEILLEQVHLKSSFTIAQIQGKPSVVIPEYTVSNHVDLLLMGTVARTSIPGFFIGNTAENILQELDCSLIAIKPPGFQSPIMAY